MDQENTKDEKKIKIRPISVVFGLFLLFHSIKMMIVDDPSLEAAVSSNSPEAGGAIVGHAIAFIIFFSLGIWLTVRGILSFIRFFKEAE